MTDSPITRERVEQQMADTPIPPELWEDIQSVLDTYPWHHEQRSRVERGIRAVYPTIAEYIASMFPAVAGDSDELDENEI